MLQRKLGCACGGGCPHCQQAALLQTKLKIGEPGDKYKQEADPVAERLMCLPDNDRLHQTEEKEQPTGNLFLFCPDSSPIQRAVNTAKLWIGKTIPMLKLFEVNKLTIGQRTIVLVALRDNFNIVDPHPNLTISPSTPLETIISNLIAIERALNQSMQYYCTSACLRGDLAWVLTDSARRRLKLPPGIINICPDFFRCDPLKQASTIIHS